MLMNKHTLKTSNGRAAASPLKKEEVLVFFFSSYAISRVLRAPSNVTGAFPTPTLLLPV